MPHKLEDLIGNGMENSTKPKTAMDVKETFTLPNWNEKTQTPEITQGKPEKEPKPKKWKFCDNCIIGKAKTGLVVLLLGLVGILAIALTIKGIQLLFAL